MATTFQVNENDQTDFQKTLADTLLSKLNIDSKFVNEVIERVVNLASKNLRSGPIKQTPQPKPQAATQTKEKEAPKPAPVQNESKPQTTSKQTTNKNENLTSNKNVFQVVDPSKQKIKLPEQDTSKQDTLFGKFTSVLEKTTNQLEQTVKKVPRPWELTPGTSMGYQMLTGKEPMGERARKGFAQFMGRYATNIKPPVGYTQWGENEFNPLPHFKNILKDEPKWLNPRNHVPGWSGALAPGSLGNVTKEVSENLKARDILYRELFDLPARTESTAIKKTKDKEYQLTDFKNLGRQRTPNQDRSIQVSGHGILGSYNLNPTKNNKYQFRDIWDLVSPGDKAKADSGDKMTKMRLALAPYLRPAAVSGTIDKKNILPNIDTKTVTEPQIKKTTTELPKNWTNEISKEVSTKLEKMPVLSSLTKGIESIKGNKMVEGLKEISSVAPSVKPIVSFLTTDENSIKPKSTIELTDSKSFGNLKNWMKDTTVSKLNNWSTDLYDWSKEKISGFTKSMDSVLTGTEKLNPLNTDSLKVSQNPFNFKPQESKNPLEGFDVDSLKSLVKGVQPDTPSLQDKINKESFTLNNGALDQIVGNTKATNEAMKTLGGAILRLAQTFNSSSRNASGSNLYGATTGQNSDIASRKRADIMGGIASASQLAATNKDPIKEVRNQFWPQWGQLKPKWG